MLNKLNKEPGLIVLPMLGFLLFFYIKMLFSINTLGMQLFNASFGIVVLAWSFFVCAKREFDVYTAKSDLQFSIAMLEGYKLQLDLLDVFYDTTGLMREVDCLIDQSNRVEDLKEMRKLNMKVEELSSRVVVSLICYEQAFRSRSTNVPHELIHVVFEITTDTR